MRFTPSQPEDFRVDEVPLFAPSGSGGHTYVRVRKRLRTTEQVARALASLAGARPRDVGYAGRKDRVAVATQWFSVEGLDPERALAFSESGVDVLEAVRHPHKLRTGQLRGNRFGVTLRGIVPDARERARETLERMSRRGMPNRFGPQRYGRDGENVERGLRLLRGESSDPNRRRARFAISALQAAVFDSVLASRAEALDTVMVGDVARVCASGGLFVVEDLAREAPRAVAFEISATGPIFGTRVLEPVGDVAECEREVLARYELRVDALRPPRGIRLRGARRPLRVRPEEVTLGEVADGLEIAFTLPSGSYASVLLEELALEAGDSQSLDAISSSGLPEGTSR